MTALNFIEPAMAADAASSAALAMPPPTAFDNIMSIAPYLAIFVVMYFFMLRPQQQSQKKHQQMLKNLQRGDRVITAGGIIGTVNKLEGEDVLVVEIADNVRVKIQRATITGLVNRTEPVANSNEPDASKSA